MSHLFSNLDCELREAAEVAEKIRSQPRAGDEVLATRRELKQLYAALRDGVRDDPIFLN